MTLRETLQTMKAKNSEKNFNIMVEGMRRRADKGMIDGVSSKDIDEILREMALAESQPQSITEKEELIGLIAEVGQAINDHGYLAEDYELSDEEMNKLALYEFYAGLDEILFEDMYEFKNKVRDYAEENPGKFGKQMAGVGAAAGAVGGGVLAADYARRAAEKAAYIKQNSTVFQKAAGAAGRRGLGSMVDSGKTAKELAREYDAANPSLLRKAGQGIVKGANAIGGFMKANPMVGAGLAGVGLAAGAAGLAALIRRRRRRQAASLREDENKVLVFNKNTLNTVKEIISDFPKDLLEAFYNESNDVIRELMLDVTNYTMSIQENTTLTEAVTYIDNNGILKTTSAKEYVANMHKYDSSTSLEKFDLKKRKNRKYSLLDEDLDSFKKLSEMSLEEILAEAEKL